MTDHHSEVKTMDELKTILRKAGDLENQRSELLREHPELNFILMDLTRFRIQLEEIIERKAA